MNVARKWILQNGVLFGALVVFALTVLAQNKNSKIDPPEGRESRSEGAIKVPRVSFEFPKDGAKVGREFTAKFKVEGLKVAKAGEVVPGTGHFHVIVDDHPAKEGEVIPADAKHLHFGLGQTEAKLSLTPGKHVLVLQFADGAHRAFGKLLVNEIHVTVE